MDLLFPIPASDTRHGGGWPMRKSQRLKRSGDREDRDEYCGERRVINVPLRNSN